MPIPSPSVKALRIQIISPHPLIAAALTTLISSASDRFDTSVPATSCDKLVTDIDKSKPDIALIDLEDEKGVECIRCAVKDSAMRVLIITSLTDIGMVDAAIAAGAMGIVRKSDPPETLFKALERVASGELWLDRKSTGRIFADMARKNISETALADGSTIQTGAINRLTRKELLIVSAVGEHPAATGQQLADLLNISENTLRNHLSTIYSKLDLANRMELFAFIHKHGIKALPARTKTSQSLLR